MCSVYMELDSVEKLSLEQGSFLYFKLVAQMTKACVKVEPLWLVFKKINLMYMVKMQKHKAHFGKES